MDRDGIKIWIKIGIILRMTIWIRSSIRSGISKRLKTMIRIRSIVSIYLGAILNATYTLF